MPSALDHAAELTATGIFVVAIVHTFVAPRIARLSRRFPRHARLFHLLGEVEIVFGFWAAVLVAALALMLGPSQALAYAVSRNYSEPLFVAVAMVVAASRPITGTVTLALSWLARRIPLPTSMVAGWLGLTVVPLLGSLLTEPAAMAIAATALAPVLFRPDRPDAPKYLALGALLVNVSIGGMLTAYAAPPVLMVASTWQWDTSYMLRHFGWKAALAVLVNATMATWALRAALQVEPATSQPAPPRAEVPAAVVLVHVALLAGAVASAHRPSLLLAVLLAFLAVTRLTARHQDPLVLAQASSVGIFLVGLVVLGGLQTWWLQPLVARMQPIALFVGALGLTSVTDNAALTYLGSLVGGMSEQSKYMLVAGAMAGGGLTVIANAPNPAAVALLRSGFAGATIGSGRLLLGAALPTAVAAAAFLLPSLR